MNAAPVPPLVVSAIGKQVFGLLLATGQVVWRFTMPNPVSPPRIHVTQHHVFVAGSVLACLDYQTGGVYWQVPAALEHNNAGAMLVAGGCLVLTAGSTVLCHSIADGRLLWHAKMPDVGGWEKMALGVPGNVTQADAR
jgi:hypothetical protein